MQMQVCIDLTHTHTHTRWRNAVRRANSKRTRRTAPHLQFVACMRYNDALCLYTRAYDSNIIGSTIVSAQCSTTMLCTCTHRTIDRAVPVVCSNAGVDCRPTSSSNKLYVRSVQSHAVYNGLIVVVDIYYYGVFKFQHRFPRTR